MGKLIIIDWGTSNFRAQLLDKNFFVLDSISSNDGMLSLKKDEFYTFLKKKLKSWLRKEAIVLMSGMVGSINGWLETPYVVCDVSLKQLAKELVKIPNIKENIYIVPGVKSLKDDSMDLMRGEEVQIFGALKLLEKKDAILILPGTHSKWVKIKDEKIFDFKTNMTGEVFNLLSTQSILAKSISSKNINEKIFQKGLELSSSDTGILNQVFQVRTQASLIGEENTYSFLSGILISNEIKQMNKLYKSDEIIIIGSSTLNKLYKIALEFYNIKTQTIDSTLSTLESMKILYKKLIHK